MRFPITAVLIAITGIAIADEPQSNSDPNQQQPTVGNSKGSVFNELSAPDPDFCGIPKEKRAAAVRKWHQETAKREARFLKRLGEEATKPKGDSRFIGNWRGATATRRLILDVDGTFVSTSLHSKVAGIWREHRERLIWMRFTRTLTDAVGKNWTRTVTEYFLLADDDTLMRPESDYVVVYTRAQPPATTAPGEQNGADQAATAASGKSKENKNPKKEAKPRSR